MDSHPTFRIDSRRPGGKLQLKWTGSSYFEVTLEDSGLHAVAEVHAVVAGQPSELPTSFWDDLAQNLAGVAGREAVGIL